MKILFEIVWFSNTWSNTFKYYQILFDNICFWQQQVIHPQFLSHFLILSQLFAHFLRFLHTFSTFGKLSQLFAQILKFSHTFSNFLNFLHTFSCFLIIFLKFYTFSQLLDTKMKDINVDNASNTIWLKNMSCQQKCSLCVSTLIPPAQFSQNLCPLMHWH